MTGTSWWQTPYEDLAVAAHEASGRRVAVVRFDLPERRNAMSGPMTASWVALMTALREDPELAAVVVTGRGQAFNAGGDRPHAVADVLRLVAEVAGTGLEPDIRGAGSPEGEIDRQYVDSGKLREMTRWRPQVDLREGLERTIEWYREHPEARAPAT